MSASPTPPIASLKRGFLLDDDTNVAAAAYVVYEYLITFDQEICTVWQRKWTLSSILLLSIRWVMILGAVFQCLAPFLPRSCEATYLTSDVLFYVGWFQVATFSGLRIMGITGGARLLACTVFALGLVPIGVNAFASSKTSFLLHCNQVLNISNKTDFALLLICRLSASLADLLVVLVTWRKTFRGWRDMSKPRCPITVSEYLLRDGTVYFIVLLLANLAQVLTQHPAFYPASVLITGFPLVLVNRFMLNLRQVQPNSISPTGSTAIPHFQCGTLYTDYGAFTSIIGNIGEPLLHASEELERNEESASPSSPLALSQEEWHA